MKRNQRNRLIWRKWMEKNKTNVSFRFYFVSHFIGTLGFIAHKIWNYLAFQSFDFERHLVSIILEMWLDYRLGNHNGCLIRSRICLAFAITKVHPLCFVVSMFLIVASFSGLSIIDCPLCFLLRFYCSQNLKLFGFPIFRFWALPGGYYARNVLCALN
jgi:hypothetical protein